MRGHIRKYNGKRGVTWTVHYYLGYDDQGKKKYSTKRGFRTKKDAETWLADLTKQLHSGEYQEPSEQLVKDFLVQWLDYKRDFVRERTIEIYTNAIIRHVNPYIGRIKLTDLKPIHLRDMYSKLQRKSNLSARSIRQIHSILHDALGRALKWELVTRNVVDAVDSPNPQKVKFEIWTLAQVREFLAHDDVKAHRFYILWLLALTTGMREGELLALRWSDIDLDKGRIQVKSTLLWSDKQFKLGPTKSESGQREIVISPNVVTALRTHRSKQNMDRLKMGASYTNNDLVTCRINGNYVDGRYVRRQFVALVEKAGLPLIRFHDLRHTHASLLLELGEELRVIQGQLGHSNISVTADTYAHISDTVRERPAQLIDKAIFG